MNDFLKNYLIKRYEGSLNQLDDAETSRSVYECYFRGSECLFTLRAVDLITKEDYKIKFDVLFNRYLKRIREVCI